jgi:predicted permease
MKWWPFRKRDADLERELRADLELEEEEQRERGVSAEEARYAARRAFGNPTLIREQTRETWGWAPLERLGQDLRYGLRQLRRSPGFTLTCVLILALGIGAATAVFSLIDAALLRMLPVEHPEQLVEFKNVNPAFPINDAFSYPTFRALGNQTQTLAGVFAFRYLHNTDVAIAGRSELAESQLVSGDYFTVLGVKPILGRTILPGDELVAGRNPVAVLGYDYWRTHFGADPAIIGKHVRLNNAPFTIVGVTAPEFYGLEPGHKIGISVPLTMLAAMNPGFAAAGSRADALTSPSRNWLHVMGRLQPGASRAKAEASLQPVFAQCMRNAADSLTGQPFDSPAVRQAFLHFRLQLDPGSQGLASLRRQFSRPLWIVMAVVGLLLLITCANVANLLLARAHAREREFAVRLALGAGKLRIMRQLLIESLLLGIAGGLAGVGLAFWGSHSLLVLMAQGRNPVTLSVHPDFGLLSFALALSLLTAVIFGIVPAGRATDVDPSRSIAQNARSAAGGAAHHRLGKSLVVVQVAISLVLIVGAGLLARTLSNLRSFYPGFNRENVLLFAVNPTIIGYKDVVPLYEQILNRLQGAPGVRVASLSVHEPLSTNASTTTVRVLGPSVQPGEDLAAVDVEPIAPDYFRALEIPILRGREFTSDDRDGSPKVAVVNESFVRHYFGDIDPIGRSVSIPGYRGDASWLRIVGEVRDIKVHDLRESPTLMLYQPMFQAPEGAATFEVRTANDPESAQTAVLDAIRAIDARLPVYTVRTLDDQLDDSLVQERLVASLSELFGLLALLLTSIGLYGLMSYSVNRRTGEIGIRMALGAGRGRVARLIVRETLLLVAFGMVLGLPGAILASRLIASQLFGLAPTDPVTFFAACAVMALVAAAASYLPARRAMRLDPMQALRTE